MRSFRKASLYDESFATEPNSDSLHNADETMLRTHATPYDRESAFSSISGLVRRSFPRPQGRSSRKGFRGAGESGTFSSNFRASMYNDHTINEVVKVTDNSSAESSPVSSGNVGAALDSCREDIVIPVALLTTGSPANRSFSKLSARRSNRNLSNSLTSHTSSSQEVKKLVKDADCAANAASLMKCDMASELSMLEDLLKSSSISPTRLMSRNFPLTSTHGSSIGSMDSDLSSNIFYDDQSSSNYDNIHINETLMINDLSSPSKGEEPNSNSVQNVSQKGDSLPLVLSCSPDNNDTTTEVQMKDVQNLETIPAEGNTSDYKCEIMTNQHEIPGRKIKFFKKLMQRRHSNITVKK